MPVPPQIQPRPQVSSYRGYVDVLGQLLIKPQDNVQWHCSTDAALDGQASAELRNAVTLDTRRKFGAFFTGSALAEKLLTHTKFRANTNILVHDATCGAGDLLLAAAQKLPLGRTFPETLRLWGRQLSGHDLHREFIDATINRLVLRARRRHRYFGPLPKQWRSFFSQIKKTNGLKNLDQCTLASHMVINPPFGSCTAPRGCKWGEGRISQAAVFSAAILEKMAPGAQMLAILPEVLRAGSVYQRWRDQISDLAEVNLVEPCGIFDKTADVDVFMLKLVRRKSNLPSARKRWPGHRNRRGRTLGDYFTVRVGQLVPFRHRKKGVEYRYIHPRCVPVWKEMIRFTESRRFEGGVEMPPFVAIRRTSRPEHPYRAAATIIRGDKPVAVENHLIICEPINGTVGQCRELMRQLKTDRVNQFLNRRIRCRHLTVGSVRAIPFQEDVK